MRLPPLRDTAYFAGLAVSLLVTVIAGISLALMLLSAQSAQAVAGLARHPWWFSYREGGEAAAPLWALGTAGVVSLLAALGSITARAISLRSPSPMLAFFIGYLFTLCLESLRGPLGLLYATNGSMSAVIILSRAVYGARFAGELSLLFVGLFALEMKYQRSAVLFAILFLLTISFAAYLPVDSTVFLSSLTLKLGDEQGTRFAEIVLGLLGTMSLIGAAVTKAKAYYILAAASALLFIGRQILSFSAPPLLLVAGALLIEGGVGLFLAVFSRLYRETGRG
jgi:hypothetical protein